MADVSKLASVPFVRTCKIDGLEGTEILAMILTQLREISQKNERGVKKSPPVSRRFTVSGFSWGPETENVAKFSHWHVYSSSLHYPMSTRAIDPVCFQASMPMMVTLFPSWKLCITNIPSINGNDTLFCSELNGEHAGKNLCCYGVFF